MVIITTSAHESDTADEYTELIRDITEEVDHSDGSESSGMEPIDKLSLFRDINATNEDDMDSGNSSPVTALQKYFESYVSIATNVPFLVVLAFNAVYGHKIGDNVKNLTSFVMIIVIFIMTTIFVKINTDLYQQTFFSLTIASIVLLSTSAGTLQSSASGIASLFPSQCMHAMVSGQAVSGLFAAMAQVLALMGHWEVVNTAFYYFLMADITLVLSLIMYLYTKQTDFYRHHKQRVKQSRRQMQSFALSSEHNFLQSIVYEIWPHLLSSTLVFWVTLSVFPAITVLVAPQRPDTSYWTGKYFIPVTCFLLYNLSDLMGRFAGRFCPIPAHSRHTVLVVAIARVALIPLIMLCNALPRAHLPVVFASEVYYVLFITLLGFSNGFVLINVMINGPTLVGYQYRERAGFLLVCCLGAGLTLGSFSSNILLRFL
ncbi:unnamed protein product [Oppiella nova]|uniref:Equilibrative nucleoside transporter 1 n=1 Tax=Oppiella nova TaxID=334625 RepID=A0A7R9LD61_9ACAR|nr:unnamed protein product [Oppiella nova]CAG2162274.1 unnamed protein product [Oppiella nova]